MAALSAVDKHGMVVVGSDSTGLFAFDRGSGAVVWNSNVLGAVKHPATPSPDDEVRIGCGRAGSRLTFGRRPCACLGTLCLLASSHACFGFSGGICAMLSS